MLAEERFDIILKLLEQRGAVTVQELTHRLNTSESTIRRDLTLLQNSGKLIKVHGGATAITPSFSPKDDPVERRQDLNRGEKMRIAQYAAQMIHKDDFVFLDAGTTTGLLVDFLTEKDATFVTGAAIHAKKLAQRGFRVFMLGGEFKASTETVVGAETMMALQKYNFTKGFFGANGVSVQAGLSTPDVSEGMVKRQAMAQCRERFVLADSSKFGKVSPVTFGDFTGSQIITTYLEDKAYRQYANITQVDLL